MKINKHLNKLLKYVSQADEISLLQYFLYEWDIKDLNELSLFFHQVLDEAEYNWSEAQENIVYKIISTIMEYKNPLVKNLPDDEQEDIYVKELKYLITACSLAKLAIMKEIKFDDVHLDEDKWQVKLT